MSGFISPYQRTPTTDYGPHITAIEKALGIDTNDPLGLYGDDEDVSYKKTPPTGAPILDEFGYPTGTVSVGAKKLGLTELKNLVAEPGVRALGEVTASEKGIKESAPEYARYLATSVGRGQQSPEEAQNLFAEFAKAYNVPGGYETASQLGGLTQGVAPASAVERYRPFQKMAAQTLGLNLSEEDIKNTEQAALSLGKVTPEAFSEFLGKRMTTSPEYIRKTPLAFAANLPYGGKYGVGYQTPEGTFTGTYRFKPPSTVNYG